jgi:ubiquinone biosynthesis protein
LERELSDFMGRHLYRPLKDIEVGKLMQELLEISTRFQLRLPPDIFLILKAISTVETVGRMLDPDFDMIAKATPFIEQALMDRFRPQRVAEDMGDVAARMLKFLHQFPKDLLDLAGQLRQHKLSLQLRHDGLEKVLATHDQISNRISFAIIIAALIIGSALIVISKTPPLFYGISLIGIIGFLAAALMGIWLLVAILKKGKL